MSDFDTIHRRYCSDVLRFAFYLCGDHSEAEDLCATAFLRAWMSTAPVRVGTVRAYLFVITRNLYRDRQRRRLAEAHARDAPLDESLTDPRPDPAAAAAARCDLDRVIRALQKLNENDRAIVGMSAFQDMSHADIAAALELSLSAVKVRLHRARLRLSGILGELERTGYES